MYNYLFCPFIMSDTSTTNPAYELASQARLENTYRQGTTWSYDIIMIISLPHSSRE